MGSSSFSLSISEESAFGDRDISPPKFIPDHDDSESGPGSDTTAKGISSDSEIHIQADQETNTTRVKTLPHYDHEFESSATKGSLAANNHRVLAATQKPRLSMKGSSRGPLREIGAPNRNLRRKIPTAASQTCETSEVSEYSLSPTAGHGLDDLVHTFAMAPKIIPTIERFLAESYYHDKVYIAVSSPAPDGTHRAKVGRLGMTSHLQRVAAYHRCGLHIVATLEVANSQRVEKIVVGLLKYNFKWKEAGLSGIAPYFQQMVAMGRKIPCPCGKGHDDVFRTSGTSHTYLENLLKWGRDRDFKDLSSAEFISKPIEQFEPPGLSKPIPKEESSRRVTRSQGHKRNDRRLLQKGGTKRRKRSERNE